MENILRAYYLIDTCHFNEAFSVIEMYGIHPFMEYLTRGDTLFWRVLYQIIVHRKSKDNLSNINISVLRSMFMCWITRYKSSIDIDKVYGAGNTPHFLVTGFLDEYYEVAFHEITLLNVTCYVGDCILLKFLVDTFSDKVIELIKQ